MVVGMRPTGRDLDRPGIGGKKQIKVEFISYLINIRILLSSPGLHILIHVHTF